MFICVLNVQHLILIPMISKTLDTLHRGDIKFVKSRYSFNM